MLQDERKRGAWASAFGAGLCLTLGLALPAQAADEPAAEKTPPLEATVVPDPNDEVLILSNGVPTTEVRIRQPEVRIYEDPHRIGEWTDQASIPTRGPGSQAADIIYHGTVDYGEPSGITVRRVGSPSSQSIRTHRFDEAVDDSNIRYHGGFR
jgi:hypothetical protein